MLLRVMAAALGVACLSVIGTAPAHAGEQVCLPFDRPYLVVILDKEFWLPYHSLPCAELP